MDIIKIAKECHISTSAAYKALYHKRGVDAATREAVFSIASQYGSVPRCPKGAKPFIGVVLPAKPSYYWNDIYRGIQSGISSETDVRFAFYSSTLSGHEGIYAVDYVSDADALIIAPSNASTVQARIAALSAHTPVFYVSDSLHTPHMATICGNYFEDGVQLARVFSANFPDKKRILALHVHNSLGTQTRTNGFLHALPSDISFVGNIELENFSAPLASIIARRIKEFGPDSFDCLYCGTGVTPYAAGALYKLHLDKKVICIGYENPKANAPYLESGLLRLLSVSNAYLMGRTAAELCTRYIVSGECPPEKTVYISSTIFQN